jgi:hypothetical protein
MIPSKGDEVAYRSIAGETWDARIVEVRTLGGDTLVDVDIFSPSRKAYDSAVTMTLKGVTWREDPKDEMPGARPRTA